MELGQNYEGSYRPARMALQRALDSGKIPRNPLEMQQRAAALSHRPTSAGSDSSQPPSPPQSPLRDGRSGKLASVGGPSASGVDQSPEMLQPQRIELPGYLNTPNRRPDSELPSPEERTHTIRRIQDLELLTFACRRAAKVREEGRAHFSLGVLRDNICQYQKAIESYNQFLRICKDCKDSQGCALSYHCIAVDYQLIGCGRGVGSGENSASRSKGGGDETIVKPELMRNSIHYHNLHRENSDAVGKFVAHLNMGLAYARLGEKEASTVNHQYALRYALQLHSLEGQSLAIGSLSFSTGMYDNDPDKMRVLIERYVDLCNTLKQPRNQASALKKLGIIASQQGDNEQSILYFQQAIDFAKTRGDKDAEKDCSVRLGIATGQAKMAEHMSAILQRSVVRGCS